MATYPGSYTAEVAGLSPKATEKDLYDFFSYCGPIQHVEILRYGDHASTAYVTFTNAYALETAVLLSGATIVDQPVCIINWGSYSDDSYPWGSRTDDHYDSGSMVNHENRFVSSPGEAVTVAQEVVKTMIAKGYVLGKDALLKAKAFDESRGVSASAAAKVAELSNRIGLTGKINAGMETVRSVDEKYHVTDISKTVGSAAVTAASYTGRSAKAAATAVVNSSYFAKGALWVSDVLARASKAAADMGNPSGEEQFK